MPTQIAYLDYSHIYAGAERVLSTIISNIDRRKFEPVLIFPFPLKHHKEYASLSCEKIYLADSLKWWMGSDRWKHPLRGSDFLKRSIFGLRLALLLKKKGIDILHVNLLRTDSKMWIWFAKKFGIKVIGHFRSMETEWLTPPDVQKCCNLILCVSRFSQARLHLLGEHAPTKVLYDSINIDYFKSQLTKGEAKKKFGFPQDSILLTSVGQLDRPKGHDNAILAFGKIINKLPNIYLFIAGGGNLAELDYLSGIVNQLPEQAREHVVFSKKQLTGIQDVYRATDLTLSLTKEGEAFGLVPYESALMGTPFIAPALGAVTEFITDGVNGNLVDPNDVDAIAAKMVYALENAEKNHEMVSKAREIILSSLSPEVMCRNLESVYDSLLS